MQMEYRHLVFNYSLPHDIVVVEKKMPGAAGINGTQTPLGS
jgi:hypothetical protein